MKRIALILLLTLAPLVLAAEDGPTTRKLVTLKYASPSQIENLLGKTGVSVRSDDRLKAIVLAGPTDAVLQAEEAIKTLDVPPPAEKNVELLAYLVLASNEASTAAESADLAPAIKQMRSLFAYKSYRLLDTIWVRTKENERIESSGLAPAALKQHPNFDPFYRLTANRATILSSGDTKTVRFDSFNLNLSLAQNYRPDGKSDTVSVNIGSSFDVREGQKVVIGKTNPTGADSAVVLIVTAKVVE